jgi:multimeric flavodoxin WrbA
MRATIINCTLKPSPERSNTEALAGIVAAALRDRDVEVDWPPIHAKLLRSEILVIATPTWLGRPASVTQRVLERMDAMLAETDEEERPVAYNRVAGVVVTGNEDGAHHVISEVSGALIDIGYTVPGQSWTYWNKGPGPGNDYLDSEDEDGKEWSRSTGEAAASNLVAVAAALAANPVPPPPSG